MSQQVNIRLSERHARLLDAIADEMGMTKTQVITEGITRVYDSLTPGEQELVTATIDAQEFTEKE